MTRKTREKVLGFAFISPWLAGLVLFAIYPIVASLVFSFSYFSGVSAPEFAGLVNYTDLFGDSLFWKSVGNTLYLAALGIPLAQILSLGAALLLNARIRFQSVYRTILFLPSIVPVVATALLWKWLLNPEFGPLNQILDAVFGSSPVWLFDPRWSKPALVMMGMWGIGGSMVIYLAGLQGIPTELYEAADIEGAGAMRKFRSIMLPMLSPVILFNLVMGIISSFQSFTTVFVMTQGGPENSTLVYAMYIFQQGFQFFKMGYASSLAWILLLITAVPVLLTFKGFRKWGYFGGVS